jgi:hypothetical protein
MMSDTFQMRIRAAAGAAWYTVLVWWLVLLGSWVGVVIVMQIQPRWVLAMLGEGATWEEIGRLYLWFMSAFKILWMVAIMFAVFLTLWSRRIRKLTKQQP